MIGLKTALLDFFGSSKFSSIISSSVLLIYDFGKGLLNGFYFSSLFSTHSVTGLFLNALT